MTKIVKFLSENKSRLMKIMFLTDQVIGQCKEIFRKKFIKKTKDSRYVDSLQDQKDLIEILDVNRKSSESFKKMRQSLIKSNSNYKLDCSILYDPDLKLEEQKTNNLEQDITNYVSKNYNNSKTSLEDYSIIQPKKNVLIRHKGTNNNRKKSIIKNTSVQEYLSRYNKTQNNNHSIEDSLQISRAMFDNTEKHRFSIDINYSKSCDQSKLVDDQANYVNPTEKKTVNEQFSRKSNKNENKQQHPAMTSRSHKKNHIYIPKAQYNNSMVKNNNCNKPKNNPKENPSYKKYLISQSKNTSSSYINEDYENQHKRFSVTSRRNNKISPKKENKFPTKKIFLHKTQNEHKKKENSKDSLINSDALKNLEAWQKLSNDNLSISFYNTNTILNKTYSNIKSVEETDKIGVNISQVHVDQENFEKITKNKQKNDQRDYAENDTLHCTKSFKRKFQSGNRNLNRTYNEDFYNADLRKNGNYSVEKGFDASMREIMVETLEHPNRFSQNKN